MTRQTFRGLVIFMLFSFCVFFASAQSTNKPVSGSELLALVAGQSLDANVIHEIDLRGLAFRPSDHYRTLLHTAGATDPIINAVNKAKLGLGADDADKIDSPEILQHIATAGKLIRAAKYEEAATELDAALQSKVTPEAGFVMATLQDRVQDWGNAGALYSRVLEMSPNFPGAHARLAFDAYKLGDIETTMKEAHAELARNSNDAEAHKNMGLGLTQARKDDAAIHEYQEALRLKPDYAAVHMDLGIVYSNRHDFTNAIAEFKKAVLLDPNEVDYHYTLANTFRDAGDLNSSVEEFYKAKRLAPTRIDIRNNLGGVLERTDRQAAIREFRELIEMAPGFEYGYLNLGISLLHDGQQTGAEPFLRKATELDPTDPIAFINLGSCLEHQGRFDSAIEQYLHASQLDPNNAMAHHDLGDVYLALKDYPASVREYRVFASLEPGDWSAHDFLARALAKNQDLDGAIAEEKTSLQLASNNPPVLARLALLLEKKGDSAGALEECRKIGTTGVFPDDATQADCAGIKKRLTASATSPSAGTNGAPAGQTAGSQNSASSAVDYSGPIIPPPAVVRPNEDVESEWQQARDAGQMAIVNKEFAEAQKTLATAVALAQRLTPRDSRLTSTIGLYAMSFGRDNQWPKAKRILQLEVDLADQIFGSNSVETAEPLAQFAGSALAMKDYGTAEDSFQRAYYLNDRLLPAGDFRIAISLSFLGGCYQSEGKYNKAEESYLKVLDMAEKNLPAGDYRIASSLAQLGSFYETRSAYEKAEPLFLRAYSADFQESHGEGPMAERYVENIKGLYIAWGKFDKAEPYCRKVLTLRERQYGVQSRMVVSSIQSLADVLDKLGKTEEAANLRKRGEAIQTASSGQNR